jgi:hypothetical protein
MLRRRPKSKPKRLDPRLGLDTVSFETFGWPLESDDGESRFWVGDGIALKESFLTDAPDYPSLDKQDLREAYERTYANLIGRMDDRDWQLKAVVLEVDVDQRVPVVRELIRLPLSLVSDSGIGFGGALTVPLADCSWYIGLQAREGGITGIREAVAFDRAVQERGERSTDEIFESFDPYDRRWDDIVPDPLSAVRSHLDRLQASIECGPEFYEQTPFSGTPGSSKIQGSD